MAIDPDLAVDRLKELIREHGEEVFSIGWDSGGMAGGGCEAVYLFGGEFWPNTELEGFDGPYDTLEAALGDSFLGISDATTEIDFSEKHLPLDRYLACVTVDATPGHEVSINGKPWRVTADGTLAADKPRRTRRTRRGGADGGGV